MGWVSGINEYAANIFKEKNPSKKPRWGKIWGEKTNWKASQVLYIGRCSASISNNCSGFSSPSCILYRPIVDGLIDLPGLNIQRMSAILKCTTYARLAAWVQMAAMRGKFFLTSGSRSSCQRECHSPLGSGLKSCILWRQNLQTSQYKPSLIDAYHACSNHQPHPHAHAQYQR